MDELHLDNRQVLRLTRTVGADRAGLSTARLFRIAIKQISQELDSNPEGKQRVGHNIEELSPIMIVISKQSLKERFTVRKKDSKPSSLDDNQDLQGQGQRKKEAVS